MKGSHELADLQQEKFCRAYIKIGKLHRAAAAVGYVWNPKKGSAKVIKKLMARQEVRDRIWYLKRMLFKRWCMEREDIIRNLMRFAEREPSGNASHDRNTISANMELAKMFGIDKPEKGTTTTAKAAVSVADLNLSEDDKKVLLTAIRQRKAIQAAEKVPLEEGSPKIRVKTA